MNMWRGEGSARLRAGLIAVVLGLVCMAPPAIAHAATNDDGNFSLLVTPSPIVTTVKPGVKTQIEFKVRNNGTATEKLKIEPRSFTVDRTSDDIQLNDTTPPDISAWISFSAPRFVVAPGEWITEQITINPPKDAGFSYAFALLISRQDEPKPISGGRLIKGSVAVFTLVNVDRPGATRSFSILKLSTSQKIYEYLPAELSLRIKNTGNTIVQPFGNVFVQRGSKDATPLATLPLNETRGYILSNSERTITAEWKDGFPAYRTVTNPDNTTKKQVVWDWAKLSKFRIGKYTVKVVAIYNNGQFDVPVLAETSFWVIPWKILLGISVVVLLLLFGLWTIVRRVFKAVKRPNKADVPPAE